MDLFDQGKRDGARDAREWFKDAGTKEEALKHFEDAYLEGLQLLRKPDVVQETVNRHVIYLAGNLAGAHDVLQ